MKVLHFRSTFSKLSETFIYDMIAELSESYGSHEVLTFKHVNESERPFGDVHCVRLPGYWHPKAVVHRARHMLGLVDRNMGRSEAHRRLVERVIKRVAPDVVHAHFGLDGLTVAPVVRKLKIPLVVSFYGIDASGQLDNPKWQRLVEREVFSQADVVALSEEMHHRLVAKGASRHRTHVVHLGKRIEDYPFSPPGQVRRFLSVGRMTEKKGHLDTVKAFAKIIDSVHNVSLDIVGGGELSDELDKLVGELGIGSSVRLRGPMAHGEVKEMMGEADAFVLSSKRAASGDCEGTPTVLLEAQASGLPCVSTWHAGIPEIVPVENHHLLAAEGDVEGIASRMVWLTQAPPHELAAIAERGRSHVQEHYDVKREASKLCSLYGSIASA